MVIKATEDWLNDSFRASYSIANVIKKGEYPRQVSILWPPGCDP